MNGSENADVWRFERDQCRKQLAENAIEIERLRAVLREVVEASENWYVEGIAARGLRNE